MYKFEKDSSNDNDLKYHNSYTLEATTEATDRDAIISDFCNFMAGCGWIMDDVLNLILEEGQDIKELESAIDDLSSLVTELEEENCILKEELESLRLNTEGVVI